MPTKPIHGQLWIDDNNILRVYNDRGAEGKWDEVCTKLVADMKYDVFNGLDFQLIDPLLPLKLDGYVGNPAYTVPQESLGKFFAAERHSDEFIYCHPGVDSLPAYNMQSSENAISVPAASANYAAKAWVHVNPYNLNKITKRLIRVPKPKARYQHLENYVKVPLTYYEKPENKGKSYLDCLMEHLVYRENLQGQMEKVVYIDEYNRMVDMNLIYPIEPIEMPEDENLDSEMEVEPLDPNPVPGDDYDNMKVTPKDPNPIPGDDFDSGMNNNE
jgi:hypothetical protein